MTAAIEPRANLPALTGIRGLAAWFVVLFHIRSGAASQLPPAAIHVFSKGYLAVDLFFMLSGFVLWLNYSSRLRDKGFPGAPAFLARRIARIWPLHVAMLGCAAAFALLLQATGQADPVDYPWAELPFHLVLVQNWGFTDSLCWNDPAWSISCEFAAYLLFPLLVMAIDWRRVPAPALLILLVALSAALFLLMHAHGAATLGADIPRFGLVRALTEFTMGTILCSLWARWRAAPRVPALAACGALLFLVPLAVTGLLSEPFAVPLLFAAVLLLVALTASSGANPLGWAPIHYLGEISYATYLVHFLLYKFFKLALVSDPYAVPLPLLGLFLLIVLAASVLLHHLLERPAQRALNRAFDSMHPMAVSAGTA